MSVDDLHLHSIFNIIIDQPLHTSRNIELIMRAFREATKVVE